MLNAKNDSLVKWNLAVSLTGSISLDKKKLKSLFVK